MKRVDKDVVQSNDQYFQGILQLRNVSDELIRFVENSIKKSDAKIAKVVRLKTGLDYYLSSQRFIRALGKKLSNAYPGELKSTRKLFTVSRKNGKEVYRVTVLFRCYDVKKGDCVLYKGDEMEVIGTKKKLKLKRKNDSKKFSVGYDDAYLRC